MAMEIFSIRWQVRHSKVRSSKPRSPGEIRANPILCLQVRHIGRSTMDDIRIAQHPTETICVLADVGLSGFRLWKKFWRKRFGASVMSSGPGSGNLALGVHPWMELDLQGLDPN